MQTICYRKQWDYNTVTDDVIWTISYAERALADIDSYNEISPL